MYCGAIHSEPEARRRVMLTENERIRLMHGDGAPPRRFFSSRRDEDVAAPITHFASFRIASSTRLNFSKSRLDYNRRPLIDHSEQFDHVLVTHPHAAVTRSRPDFVLVFGAMNVHEAVARVRIVLIQSVEPQNT